MMLAIISVLSACARDIKVGYPNLTRLKQFGDALSYLKAILFRVYRLLYIPVRHNNSLDSGISSV